jgi:hypothetical protein
MVFSKQGHVVKVTRRQLRKLILESLDEKMFIEKISILFQAGEFAQAVDFAETLGIPLRKLPWKIFYAPEGFDLFDNFDINSLLDLAGIVIKVLEPMSKAHPPSFSSADLAKDIQALRGEMQAVRQDIEDSGEPSWESRRYLETTLRVMIRHNL